MNVYQLAKDKAFLVAVKALILNSKNEILFLKVGSKLNDSAKWDLPGGLMAYEDTVESGLKREVFEETGLKLEEFELAGCAETVFEKFVFEGNEVKDVRVVVIAYKYRMKTDNSQIQLSSEHDDYTWSGVHNGLSELRLSRPSEAVIKKLVIRENL